MDCPPSSPPRLLPGFAPNKTAKFQIYQDNAPGPVALLPTPLPTSERDIESSPGPQQSKESSVPTRRVLGQLKTIRLRPDIPVLVGRSSRACEFVLKCTNKLVSRIHARICYEAASELVTVECLGWNGLSVIVPGKKGPKEYPVVRNQTIYIEKVTGIEVSIQNIRTFVEVASGPSETTEDEADFKNTPPQQPDSSPLPAPRSDVIERTIAALKATAAPVTPKTGSTNDNCKENITPKRVHFAPQALSCTSKVELSKPKVTTLAEYRERRRSMAQETRPEITESEPTAPLLAAPFKPSADTTPEPVELINGDRGELELKGEKTPAIESKEPKELKQPAGELKEPVDEPKELIEPNEPIESKEPASEFKEPTESPAPIEPKELIESKEPASEFKEPVGEPKEPTEPKEPIEPHTPRAPTPQPPAPIESKEPAGEPPAPPQKPHRKRKIPTTKPKPAKKSRTTPAFDTETLERLAANCVAFSRLNSTPLSHIIASSHEMEGIEPGVVAQILQGMACIGVIQREGKDALGKPLEPEYYYISELDANTERQQMVMQSKGGKSLRACRRVHKQYFYKRPK